MRWIKEPFTIMTDHANLQYWKSPRNLNQRMARWHADLQEYDYKIQHVPGKANVPPDALSRLPGIDQGKDDNHGVTVLPPKRFVSAVAKGGLNKQAKRSIMTLAHDHHTAGHSERDETIRKAWQHAQWEGMNQWIAEYIKGCTTCQQAKNLTHKQKIPLYHI